jgi:hypothetical protein
MYSRVRGMPPWTIAGSGHERTASLPVPTSGSLYGAAHADPPGKRAARHTTTRTALRADLPVSRVLRADLPSGGAVRVESSGPVAADPDGGGGTSPGPSLGARRVMKGTPTGTQLRGPRTVTQLRAHGDVIRGDLVGAPDSERRRRARCGGPRSACRAVLVTG